MEGHRFLGFLFIALVWGCSLADQQEQEPFVERYSLIQLGEEPKDPAANAAGKGDGSEGTQGALVKMMNMGVGESSPSPSLTTVAHYSAGL